MNDRITIGAASLMGALTLGTALVRRAVTPVREPGRHRAEPRLVPLEDLLGPDTAYTTGFEHAPAPIRPSFGDCPTCGPGRAGSLNRDGWLCGECLTPARAGGAR